MCCLKFISFSTECRWNKEDHYYFKMNKLVLLCLCIWVWQVVRASKSKIKKMSFIVFTLYLTIHLTEMHESIAGKIFIVFI